MSKQTEKSLFIFPPLAAKHSAFYQQVLCKVSSFQELGNKLISYVEQAHTFRLTDRVREAAEILSSFPLKQYQPIGQFYLAWCERKNGDGSVRLLERVAESAPPKYRARAMHVLATIAARKQDSPTEFRWLMESLKVIPSIESLRGIAVLKAREDYHESALADLENLLPLIPYARPLVRCDVLNSYAVELGKAGRLIEARNICRVVLASPFAFAYPEWRETAEDLRESNRSFVAIGSKGYLPRKVLPMPAIGYGGVETGNQSSPAKILNLEKWKKKMGKGKKSNGENKPVEEMDGQDMILRIMRIYTSPDTTDDLRRKIYIAVEKVVAESQKPTPDDDDSEGA